MAPEQTDDPNIRRSRRNRMKPTAWYAGEQPLYQRRESGKHCATGHFTEMVKDGGYLERQNMKYG